MLAVKRRQVRQGVVSEVTGQELWWWVVFFVFEVQVFQVQTLQIPVQLFVHPRIAS